MAVYIAQLVGQQTIALASYIIYGTLAIKPKLTVLSFSNRPPLSLSLSLPLALSLSLSLTVQTEVDCYR